MDGGQRQRRIQRSLHLSAQQSRYADGNAVGHLRADLLLPDARRRQRRTVCRRYDSVGILGAVYARQRRRCQLRRIQLPHANTGRLYLCWVGQQRGSHYDIRRHGKLRHQRHQLQQPQERYGLRRVEKDGVHLLYQAWRRHQQCVCVCGRCAEIGHPGQGVPRYRRQFQFHRYGQGHRKGDGLR